MQHYLELSYSQKQHEVAIGDTLRVPLLEEEAILLSKKGKNCIAQLKKMGAIERFKALESVSDNKIKQELHLGLNRLIDIDEMGKLFKVLAITSNKFPSPEGFTCGTRSS